MGHENGRTKKFKKERLGRENLFLSPVSFFYGQQRHPIFFLGGQGQGSWKGRRKRNKRALQPAVKLCGRGRGGGGRGERSNSEKEGSPHSSKKKNSMLSLKKKTLLFFSLEGGNGQEKKPLLFSPRPVSKLTQNRFLHPLGKKQLFFVLFLL